MAATIAVLLGATAAVLLWRTEVPGDLRLERVAPAQVAGEAQLRESERYGRVARGLRLGSALAQLAALALLVAATPRLERRFRLGWLARGLALLGLALATVWLVRLPFGAAAHWWRRRHGLSEQGYLGWLVDPWPELLATVGTATFSVLA